MEGSLPGRAGGRPAPRRCQPPSRRRRAVDGRAAAGAAPPPAARRGRRGGADRGPQPAACRSAHRQRPLRLPLATRSGHRRQPADVAAHVVRPRPARPAAPGQRAGGRRLGPPPRRRRRSRPGAAPVGRWRRRTASRRHPAAGPGQRALHRLSTGTCPRWRPPGVDLSPRSPTRGHGPGGLGDLPVQLLRPARARCPGARRRRGGAVPAPGRRGDPRARRAGGRHRRADRAGTCPSRTQPWSDAVRAGLRAELEAHCAAVADGGRGRASTALAAGAAPAPAAAGRLPRARPRGAGRARRGPGGRRDALRHDRRFASPSRTVGCWPCSARSTGSTPGPIGGRHRLQDGPPAPVQAEDPFDGGTSACSSRSTAWPRAGPARAAGGRDRGRVLAARRSRRAQAPAAVDVDEPTMARLARSWPPSSDGMADGRVRAAPCAAGPLAAVPVPVLRSRRGRHRHAVGPVAAQALGPRSTATATVGDLTTTSPGSRRA